MGGTAGRKHRDVEDRLRHLGLRKALAKRIAENAADGGGRLPKSARQTIKGGAGEGRRRRAGVRKPTGEDRKGDGAAAGGRGDAVKRDQEKTLTKQLAKKIRKARKKSAGKAQKVKKAAAGRARGNGATGRATGKGKGKGKGKAPRSSE